MTPDSAQQRFDEVFSMLSGGTERWPRLMWPAALSFDADQGPGGRDDETALLDLVTQALVSEPLRPLARLDPPDPPDPPELGDPPPAAAQIIQMLLGRTPVPISLRYPLLQECLDLMAERGWHVPSNNLMYAFREGKENPHLRPALRPVLDSRGRWMAQFGDDWVLFRDVLDPEAEIAASWWHHASAETKLGRLQAVRGADPEAGRDLLVSVLADDKVTEPAKLVPALSVGLSMADEPLLESFLDRPELSGPAARLLRRLPQSRFVARMAQRLRASITLTPTGQVQVGYDLIVVDDLAERDGVVGRHAFQHTSERTLAACAPLQIWEDFGPPHLLLGQLQHWHIEGLAEAAQTQQNRLWATALVEWDPVKYCDLIGLLDMPDRFRLAREALAKGLTRHGAAAVLDTLTQPWPEDFSREAVEAVRVHTFYFNPPVAMATYLHPAVMDELAVLAAAKEQADADLSWSAMGLDSLPKYQVLREHLRAAFA